MSVSLEYLQHCSAQTGFAIDPLWPRRSCADAHGHAAEYIQQAPINMSSLRALAEDREFKEMLKSKYRSAFHLPEE